MKQSDLGPNGKYFDDADYVAEEAWRCVLLVQKINESIERFVELRGDDESDWTDTDERGKCWKTLSAVSDDLQIDYKAKAQKSPNGKFTRCLVDLKGNSTKKLAPLVLAWYSWYDPKGAGAFYKESGLSSGKKPVQFRAYVGEPGDLAHLRRAKTASPQAVKTSPIRPTLKRARQRRYQGFYRRVRLPIQSFTFPARLSRCWAGIVSGLR